jgi:hypothetical protein
MFIGVYLCGCGMLYLLAAAGLIVTARPEQKAAALRARLGSHLAWSLAIGLLALVAWVALVTWLDLLSRPSIYGDPLGMAIFGWLGLSLIGWLVVVVGLAGVCAPLLALWVGGRRWRLSEGEIA